ncbi:hypothetical protein Zmor_009706 [Zophobas morio]|uniref:Uncharacterized protein n=1 Tax=Zophobas morio TaxID=2755281 RepID=A0AA38IJJ6_9CUCU|nr:hypothetical protein Zmor_009706 [Zophobas morio]
MLSGPGPEMLSGQWSERVCRRARGQLSAVSGSVRVGSPRPESGRPLTSHRPCSPHRKGCCCAHTSPGVGALPAGSPDAHRSAPERAFAPHARSFRPGFSRSDGPKPPRPPPTTKAPQTGPNTPPPEPGDGTQTATNNRNKRTTFYERLSFIRKSREAN